MRYVEDPKPEEWWLHKSITSEQRKALTPEQKAERRTRMVHHRLEEAEQKLTNARRRQLTLWLNQWVRGEMFREMKHGHREAWSLKRWLQAEFVTAVRGMLKGSDIGSLLEDVVRKELAELLGTASYNQQRTRAVTSEYIQKLVEKEVRKQVTEALSFDISVKGRVFKPTAGQRRVDLGHDEEHDDAEA